MATNAAYQEAEKKIEEALHSGAKELDLSAMWGENDESKKLTELPESLGQLTQLQTLDLSRNQLTALPESLGQLTQLQSLNLSSNQLTALPESLGQLTQLQELNLSNNQLTALRDSLGLLTQLQALKLSFNELKALPESLGQLTQLQSLDLSQNQLTALPESLGQLTQLSNLDFASCKFQELPSVLRRLVRLTKLRFSANALMTIPNWIGELIELRELYFPGNRLTQLPDSLGTLSNLRIIFIGSEIGGNPLKELPRCIASLSQLETLDAKGCELGFLPSWIGELPRLKTIWLHRNGLTDLPASLGTVSTVREMVLDGNPLNPELAAAYKEGIDSVKRYLRAKAEAQVVLNEVKLILIGEGEVGKSCLLGALRGDPWEEDRPSTHGIEIKPVKVTAPDTGTEITLNGWDFGGQRVYRPTHQLFFSAPAVYLVVWKPREGPQQGFVKEWIKLVKHREPEAKIIVVATHGGPKERQPDIDRQEIWDLFGRETVVDFFFVDSKNGENIASLRNKIASVAASLPEVGRTFPKHWHEVREKLRTSNDAYLPLSAYFAICQEHKIEEDDACVLLRICRRVGDLIYYEHDPVLKDIVILKPDWLATAMSFVLDDKDTREESHGLVKFDRLGKLWNDPDRAEENRYPAPLHPIFLRLMERFDLSYRITEAGAGKDGTSLIAQLVPDVRPEQELDHVWSATPASGDEQQVQICRIVETSNNQSATAEGLFYQLIVRLHKYSLGRADFCKSVHWQRGLVLEDDTGARAFLEHIGNDVRISVRSPYPPSFLGALTHETKWLVEDFWKGIRCEVTVPCLVPKTDGEACKGLFEVGKLLENKKRGRPEVPCPICNEWQNIEQLLGNAPAARPNPITELLSNLTAVMAELNGIRQQLAANQSLVIGRFDKLDVSSRQIVGKVEAAYSGLMRTLLDEAKEGPRLFSFEPVEPGFWDRPKWMSTKFRLTLWCEHSRMPFWFLTGKGDESGVYEITIPRDWLVKAAPFLKLLTGTLALVAPVASAATKLVMDDTAYKAIENQLGLGEKCFDALLKGGEKAGEWLAKDDALDLERGEAIEARGAVLRQLHAWLKEKDPGFGGLVRVMNRRQEFLWVHPQFEKDY